MVNIITDVQTVSAISNQCCRIHLSIYDEDELDEASICRNLRQVRKKGKCKAT